jgi:hypothetical protein
MRADLERELDATLEFIEQMNLPSTSRLWKKADLFTAIVELHSAIFKRQALLDPDAVARALLMLYAAIDDPESRGDPETDAGKYYKASLQATNDRSSRIARGEIFRRVVSIYAGHGNDQAA